MCILCGSYKINLLYPGKSSKKISGAQKSGAGYKITQSAGAWNNILRCEECGLIFQEVQANKSEILEWYIHGQDDQYLKEFKNRVNNSKRMLRVLSDDGFGKRLLDVGCSTGILLQAAKEMSYEVYGVEPSRWAVDYVKAKLGLEDVFCGSLETYPAQEGYFDVVTLMDVIEHLPNPRHSLEIIRRLLKPEGKIIILTPDIGSFTAKLFKSAWWCIIPEHLFYFSRETLKHLLDQTGFVIEKQRSIGRTFNLSHWIYKVVGERHKPLVESSVLSKIPFYINLGDQMLIVGTKRGGV
jgi:2-polyprenyl-3-methyl-5-hydroxy-6-metoxy-1,4-benzoquinol methylase